MGTFSIGTRGDDTWMGRLVGATSELYIFLSFYHQGQGKRKNWPSNPESQKLINVAISLLWPCLCGRLDWFSDSLGCVTAGSCSLFFLYINPYSSEWSVRYAFVLTNKEC
jgi:hypothetical protein